MLNDGFQYSLYDDFEAALTDGKRRGSDQQQTDDIDEEAVFAYTDAALQYVFDYSDELIQLQELADGLSPPTSSRVSPGERIALLAELMAGEVLKEVSQLLPVDGPAYSRIALYVGVNVTYIYHPVLKA
ncbi:hypothetical protein HED54_03675 [Ochrobactrum anthropi ATCC 49188]|nr:hypothetical protein [Brucella anthropi ATCC 49188]